MEENSEKSSRNKVQQSSILSFVKSKPVKSRISEEEDENSEGIQAQRQPEFRSLDDNITAIKKVTEKGGPCSTTTGPAEPVQPLRPWSVQKSCNSWS